MGLITAIIALISALPQLIQAIQQIMALIHGLPLGERRQAMRELRDAMEAAKNGDPQKLKDLHQVLCKELPGGGGCSQ